MPHPRAKVRTQMPLPWDVLDKQMPRGGMGTLGFDSCINRFQTKVYKQTLTFATSLIKAKRGILPDKKGEVSKVSIYTT